MDSTLTTATPTNTSFAAAWRRRPFSFISRRSGYVRLHNDVDRIRNPRFEQLGDPRRSRLFWKWKTEKMRRPQQRRRRRRRLKIRALRGWRWWRMFSPKKWLTKLRDAYVNMMLRIAGSAGAGFHGCAVDYGGAGFTRPALKEYDEKVIVEIYKSLVAARGQIVACDAGGGGGGGAKVGSELVWRAGGIKDTGIK